MRLIRFRDIFNDEQLEISGWRLAISTFKLYI